MLKKICSIGGGMYMFEFMFYYGMPICLIIITISIVALAIKKLSEKNDKKK